MTLGFSVPWVLVFALAGCGASHTAGDAGPADSDAARPDAGTTDASTTGPLSCTGEMLGADGDGCFCQGPFATRGDLAYRAAYDLEVHDVSGGDVRVIARIPQARPSSEGAVVIAADHVFVGGLGVEVFDLATPETPASVATMETGQVVDLAVDGTTLFAAVEDGEAMARLVALDVSTPASPREVGSLALDGRPGSVLVEGPGRLIVFEARRFGEMGPDVATRIDAARPDALAVTSRVPLGGRAVLRRRGAVSGGLLYAAGNEPVLQIVDLASETVVGRLVMPDGSSGVGVGVSVADGLAFVGDGRVDIADVRDPRAPRWAGNLPIGADTFYVQPEAGRVLVSNGGQLSAWSFDCR